MTLAVSVIVSYGADFDEYIAKVDSVIPEKPDPAPDSDPGSISGNPESYWYQAADSAAMELLCRYWPPLLSRRAPARDVVNYWAFTERNDERYLTNTNYWQQAHAMDAIIDAYNRTPSTGKFVEQKDLLHSIYGKWFKGVTKMQWMGATYWGSNSWTSRYPGISTGNAGGWRNEYIDDMEWMALTHIRMYESLVSSYPDEAATYLNKAKEIYNEFIWKWAWDTNGGGGLFWKRDTSGTNSKNACSNGPGMIIAAKLAYYSTDETERKTYLEQADAIYLWMMGHLWNTNGSIADAWNGSSKVGGATTYNQGTFIGGCHWLYKLTGNETYLTSAIAAVKYTLNSMQDTGEGNVKILRSDEGGEDGDNNSVFRAIFLRYFVPLINETVIDKIETGLRKTWYKNLENWADYVWRDGKGIDKGNGTPANLGKMLFGSTWTRRTTSNNVHLGNQVSGTVLVESMNIASPVE